MKYWIRLSLWDPAHKEKYLGDPATWERAQEKLETVLTSNKIDFKKAEGEAAIYGPKMDFIAVDALGREWQISTVQLDFIMPGRFGLEYTDVDGTHKTPVMIHRAILGSPERFLGLLIEHYAGAFPLWLAPVQVAMLPISEHELDYVKEVAAALTKEGIRVEVDETASTLGKKMVRAREQKVPYLAIIGKQEVENKTVTLKNRAGEQITLTLDEVIAKLRQEIVGKV
jgi:threonyl-tRNA synthetase